MDYNNAASIPEWMWQMMAEGGAPVASLAHQQQAMRAQAAGDPLSAQGMENAILGARIKGHMQDVGGLLPGDSRFGHAAQGYHNQANALKNALYQRMQRGQSLPPGLLDQ